jgi:hypothetical protein
MGHHKPTLIVFLIFMGQVRFLFHKTDSSEFFCQILSLRAAHAESLQFPAAAQQHRPAAAKRPAAADVNPEDFMAVGVKKLRSDLPEIVGYNEEENSEEDEDEDEEQRKTIAEAFADDDVMADFRKEKADIIAASKPKVGIMRNNNPWYGYYFLVDEM